jgi:hypothetical protein
MKFSKIDVARKSIPVQEDETGFVVTRKEWDQLIRDVQEIKENVNGMVSAMSAIADGASALSSSPLGKMLGNMFPTE